MNILTIGVIVLGLVIAILVIAIILMMISTTKELTEAIRNININKAETEDESLDKVKFIGPTNNHFGRSPGPRKGMKKNKHNKFIGPKNRKDWGVH